jgi:soluble lytic murein transglycosylase-like protein
MARIEVYQAQQSLQPGNTPSANLSSAVGQELEGAGAAVSNAAAMLIEREERKENFTAENAYRRLKLELERDLVDQQASMAPDGTGFHESFVTGTFRPKRDEFLQKVPERLRPQFEAVLNDDEGPDAFEWSTRAATVERDRNYAWQRDEINLTQQQLQTAIAMNPDGYDALLADGQALIEASSLPTPERAKMLTEWENLAQFALLDQLLKDDPQSVLRDLGVDARNLSTPTQFAILSRAVQWQESRDNPNAVSPKGAMGLMQVMPGTAAEIAGKVGDTNFPTGAPENVIRAYMSNPHINKMYGEFYLREQLRDFANTRNPIETALVAYNAGPGTAKKWVESGYDDSTLPKETRDYKTEIMASISAPGAKGDPSTVKFNGKSLEGVKPELQSRVADAYASIGLDNVRVTSGYRDADHNKAVGGAENSEHIHGNAMDIDVTNMKIADRVELIKALSAAGVTGLGIGSNIIHADLGGRRAWGYATSAGGGEVPKWAQGVISEHLAGTTPPIRKVSGRFGSVPYDARKQYTSKADQIIAAQTSAAARSTAVEIVQVRQSRDNNLALIRATGQGDPNFDETAISTILGEDDYLKYARDKDVAERSFTGSQGINEMTDADMEQRYNDYNPRPGESFEADQRVQAAVRNEIDRVMRLRAKSPDRAVLELPEVKGVAMSVAEDISAGTVEPAKMQDFITLMLNKQADLGINPQARAPIPREWAMQIGRTLAELPRPSQLTPAQRAAMKPDEIDAFRREDRDKVAGAIYTLYTALESVYGEYTDEVVSYALSEYRGVDKKRADLLASYARAVQDGTGQIFDLSRRLESATDMEQSDAAFTPTPFWMLPGKPPTADAPLFGGGQQQGEPIDPEVQLRMLEEGDEQ